MHYATVIDNNDPDKKAKIQVRVLPEMKDMEESKLPWVRPFLNAGMSATEYDYNPPQNDSKVWTVFTDKFFKHGMYITGSFIDGFFDYSSIETALGNISELSGTDYDKLRFNRLPDGTIIFHNDDTGEVGVYHSSGKYILIDENGDIKITSDINQIGDLFIDGKLEVGTSGTEPLMKWTSFQTAMNTLLVALSTHIHADPLTGSTGPPFPGSPLTTYTSTGAPLNMDPAESQDSKSS